jgi:hypothetical protein
MPSAYPNKELKFASRFMFLVSDFLEIGLMDPSLPGYYEHHWNNVSLLVTSSLIEISYARNSISII